MVTRVPLRTMAYSHVGTFMYLDKNSDLHDDPAFWYKFLDSVQGSIDGLTHLQAEAGNSGCGELCSNQQDAAAKLSSQPQKVSQSQAARKRQRPSEGNLVSEVAMVKSQVIINDFQLSDEDVEALEQRYGVRIQDGAYWYDRATGAWGTQGGPTLGWIEAGLGIGGPLKADASRGNTGVFINGRELHMYDVVALQRLGPVYPGRYWVDARGNFGFEGGPALGNLMVAARMSGAAGGGGPWTVSSSAGTAGGDGNGFLFFQGGGQFWSN
jgi:hypothetical protein